MDLTQFALGIDSGSNDRAKRKFAIEFFSGLANDPRILEEHWHVLMGLGEQFYFMNPTDDGDYLKGGMDLRALDRFHPEIREQVLDYMHAVGNWIVKHHIDDYVSEQDARYKAVA
jgi:hypothetical protein